MSNLFSVLYCKMIDIEEILNSKNNIFITGKAGTGKTTLTKKIIKNLEEKKEKFVVLAPTGIAALNVGGVTIHRFFKFPPKLPVEKAGEYGEEKSIFGKLYKELEVIIIDEISMVRADLMDAIDIFFRKVKQNNIAFGGVKMIFVGDLFQLPPIVTENEKKIFFKKYDSSHFFSANVFKILDTKIDFIELQKVYRQTDEKFVKILNNIRDGNIDFYDLEILNQAKNHKLTDKHIILTTTNSIQQKINKEKLDKLNTKSLKSKIIINGFLNEDEIYFEELLTLKEKARVIFLKNDSEKKFINGDLGTILEIKDNSIKILKDSGKIVNLEKQEEFIYEFYYNSKKRKIEKRIKGSFFQFPIKLAWAITIHKSQGMTYDFVSINLGSGSFANGQTYVALSRVRNFEGLHLEKEITQKDIKTDKKVLEFFKKFHNKKIIILKEKDLEFDVFEDKSFKNKGNSKDYFESAKELIKEIELNGGKAYIVGGYPRNKIMGLSLDTDIDITTDLTPESLKKYFNVVDIKGERFGVLIIKKNGFVFEVSTFRKEYFNDFKNQTQFYVKFIKKFEEDAKRRDFSLNAIYYDPLNDKYLSFNDYDGIEDAKNKIIRFIGNPEDRIKEDPLRLLRYVRFKYNFGLKDTNFIQYEIVKKNFYLLKQIPFERIKIELEKIFVNNNTVNALKELKDLGFFKIFIPEIDNLEKIPGGAPYHLEGNVWIHTLMVIEELKKAGVKESLFYWMALFHDVGKVETYKFKEKNNNPNLKGQGNIVISYIGHEEKSALIFEKYKHSLKFKIKEYDEIKWIIRNHLKFGLIPKMRNLKRNKLFLHKYFEDFLVFCKADNLGRIPAHNDLSKQVDELYLNFKKNFEKIKNDLWTGEKILEKYPNLKGKKIGERLESLNNEILSRI